MMMTLPFMALLSDVGAGEILVILLAALILFGGKGLPSLARKLGSLSLTLQKAATDFKRQILTADLPPPTAPPPEPPNNTHADKP
jgi:Sec-independent protein translocase protein TatA